jgi:predicted TIM-barrel fold metal-dependent hydrolase
VYAGETVPAIDMHLHTGRFSTMGPLGQAFLIKTLNLPLPQWLVKALLRWISTFQLDPYGKYIGIQTECYRAGLSACLVFSVYAPETWGITSNEFIIERLNDTRNLNQNGTAPYFFGFASVNQSDWENQEQTQLAALRQALAHPSMLGIKLAFIHNTIPLDDRRFDSIYDVAAETGVPVYHHLGSSPLRDLNSFTSEEDKQKYLRSYNPTYLEQSIADHPNTLFILGHMGFDFNNEGLDFRQEVFSLASKYPNVYLEISAFGRSAYDPDGAAMDAVLSEAKSRGLTTRLLYGSDGPGNPGSTQEYLQRTLASMSRVGYTAQEAKQVLAENLIRLTKLKNIEHFSQLISEQQ